MSPFDLAVAVGLGLAAALALELLYLLLRRLGRPPRLRLIYHLWAVAAALTVGLAAAGRSEEVAWRVTASVAGVLTAFVLFSLLDSLVVQRPWDPARRPMMPKLARDVLRIAVLAAAVLVVAKVILGYSLEAVLVSSTVISAVVGLALQDVLKNVFAGMALEIEHPFQRGDWILLDGEPVQVIDTSWRSTRLRSNEGVELYEPNATFATARLVRYGSGTPPVALSFQVGLPYDAPPARVKAALVAAARAAPLAAEKPAPEAFLDSYGESAIGYRLRVWTHSVGQVTAFRDGVYSRVWYELQRQGLSVPFPIRTVHVHSARRERKERERTGLERTRRLLAQVDLFRELEAEKVERLALASTLRYYDQQEVLVREGETGESLFVIERGQVLVAKSGALIGTGTIQLATLGPGSFFGEMSLLTGEPRSATVVADGPCEVVELSKEALAPLLEEDPRLAEVVSAAVATREASTAATFEVRRESARAPSPEASQVQASILARIRSFFKLDPPAA
jgi:small-conductance mechanosensitive channel/CRP-like cAMP-binding protein